MDAKKLYQKLDVDFELDKCKDDWSKMEFNEFISHNFKKRYMGILADNSEEIEHVFTAVFPSGHVLEKIIRYGVRNALLVVHHPMVWDIRKSNVFSNMNPVLLQKFKERKNSIYVMHVPLDKNGKYSTATTLAKALGMTKKGEFCEYFGVKVGIIGNTKLKTPEELVEKVEEVVGHEARLWKYGSDKIEGRKVAVIGGGGNEAETIEEITGLGINTFVTGVTLLNRHSRAAHNAARKNCVNIIGATHYSTEKFACMALCNYFDRLNLPCEFIPNTPVMEDMG